MSTLHTGLEFKRFVRQVQTGPSAVIVTASMAEQNYLAIQDEGWREVAPIYSTMPIHNYTTNPVLDSFDAYKYASDYVAESGVQNAYAGAVAYRVQLPADAVVATAANVTQVELSLYVDRWLIGGVRVATYLSDIEVPPSDWATIKAGDAYTATVLPATDPRSDQNTTVTVTMADVSKKYLYVMVSLEDMESVSPLDSRQLEGGSLIIGQTIATTFSRSVAADPSTDLVFEVNYVGDSFDADICLNVFENKYYNGKPVAVFSIANSEYFPYKRTATLVSGDLPSGDFWIFAFVDKDGDGVFKSGGICGVPHNAPLAVDLTSTIPLNMFAESDLYGVTGLMVDAAYTHFVSIFDSAVCFPTLHWTPVALNATDVINKGQSNIQIKNTAGYISFRRNAIDSATWDETRPAIIGRDYIHIGDWLSSPGGSEAAITFEPRYGLPSESLNLLVAGSGQPSVASIMLDIDFGRISVTTFQTPSIISASETYTARPVIKFSTPDAFCSTVEIDVEIENPAGTWTRTIGTAPLISVMPPLEKDGEYRFRISEDLADGSYKVLIRTISMRATGPLYSTQAEMQFDVALVQ